MKPHIDAQYFTNHADECQRSWKMSPRHKPELRGLTTRKEIWGVGDGMWPRHRM